MTKGKIAFPPKIEIYKNQKSRWNGAYGNGVISLNAAKNSIEKDFIHEAGHYNHELTSPNYLKMGKRSELFDDGVTDFSILNEFEHDNKTRNLIQKCLGGYAASSPAEFVACTLEAIGTGQKLPLSIWLIYKKYEGPCANEIKRFFIK